MYYRDPDGNVIETQVDNCGPDEATAYLTSPAFAKNPIGADFDPEELATLVLDRGESEEALKQPKDVGERSTEEMEGIVEKIRGGLFGVF